MAKKGERKISATEILSIVDQEGGITPNRLASITNTNYRTALNRLEELVQQNQLSKVEWTPAQNTQRIYISYEGAVSVHDVVTANSKIKRTRPPDTISVDSCEKQ